MQLPYKGTEPEDEAAVVAAGLAEVARVVLDFWVARVVLLAETTAAEEEALLVAATFEEEATAVEVATAAFEEVVIATWDATEAEDLPPLAMRAETGVLPGKKEVGMVGIGMLTLTAKGVAKSWAMVEAS